MEQIINFILEIASAWGYFGIIFLMTLESCFIPFPSEIVMIPAGFLASKNELNIWLSILCGVIGSVFGALINYFICYFWGKKLILKYGKFFGITDEKFTKFENFFNRHGEFSTLSCRLIPGIRQYISMPAGLAKMKLKNFIIFTALGSTIWVSILVFLGYFLGQNEALIKQYLNNILAICFILIIIGGLLYFKLKKSK